MRRVALILLQVQEGHPGLDVCQGKDEGPGFPEQLVALWWRLPAGCRFSSSAQEEKDIAVGEPLSVHLMDAAETLGFAASAFLSAQEARELLVWFFWFLIHKAKQVPLTDL